MADPDVSAASILGERGIRYKRNTLAASLIATVLYWTNASLEGVSLFGVSLSNVEDKEAAAWIIFSVILGYQWVMLTYYGWTDWSIWQQRVREAFHLSGQNIAFWINEGAEVWAHGVPSRRIISVNKNQPQGIGWEAKDLDGASTLRVVLSHSDRNNIRWRLLAFLTMEFGLPFLWGLYCLYLALSKILGWTITGAIMGLF